MAFWGTEFIFDDIPCSEFGLMVYHFGSNGQDDVSFKNGEIIEDRIPGRYDALTYGLVQNQSLEYTLVFGANMESLDANANLDRFEVEAIAAWLTGHSTRKWLVIVQNDMEPFRYKCTISELKLITYGDLPWAFSCKVSCDSPFAYTLPDEYIYTVSGQSQVRLFNRSSYNGFYRPKMEITMYGGDGISIQNLSDNNRTFPVQRAAGRQLFNYICGQQESGYHRQHGFEPVPILQYEVHAACQGRQSVEDNRKCRGEIHL